MIEKLINFALRQRLLTATAAVALCAMGVFSMLTISVDSFPDVSNVQVQIITEPESMATEEVETLITYPITQTHADLSKEELDRNGITDRILRLSVGIDGAEDLIADLEAVLK